MQSLIGDLIAFLEVGGYLMPPLVLATLLLWYAIGFRYAALKRGNPRSVRVLIEQAEQGVMKTPSGIIDHAIVIGLDIARSGRANVRRYLDDAFAGFEQEIGRYRIMITAVVAVAPLMGLLGTVVGMIETFESLGDMTLFAQSGGIAGGISQALFTTQMGLAIAIPGLIVKGYLDKKQQRIEIELAQVKDLLAAKAS